MSGTSDYRPDIDGLRAVSVLAVLVFHARERLAPGGFVGVDVFFVISGYLISGIILKDLQRGTFTFADFYSRRVRRIFPALALVLAATWCAGWWMLDPTRYAVLGRHIAAGAGFVSNIVLWNESGYFDLAARQKPLLHLWSLAVEEQFYLIWPPLLLVAWRRQSQLLALLGGLTAASFLVNIATVDRFPVAAFYLPFSRLWELSAGALLAVAQQQHRDTLRRMQDTVIFRAGRAAVTAGECASALGLAAIIAAVFLLADGAGFPGWRALLPVAGAVAVLFGGPGSVVSRRVLSLRGLVMIGLISYPLYLWHWPLLVFGGRLMSGGLTKINTLILVAAAFAASIATYRLVELPIRFGAISRRGRIALTLAASVFLLGGLGLVTASRGWDVRYPAAVRPFLHAGDYEPAFRTHQCMLTGEDMLFADFCAGKRQSPEQPLFLIWGDSHGAMLNRELATAANAHGMALAQYTSSACPPILGFEMDIRPHCRALNDEAFRQITRLRPVTVLLAADWPQYLSKNALSLLPATVTRLRDSGVQNIVLLGAVPHWNPTLAEAMAQALRSTKSETLPERSRIGLSDDMPQVEAELAAAATRLSLHYVSAYQTFCNNDGCLIKAAPDEQELTSFDNAHLTASAARFLIGAHQATLFPAIR